MIPGWLRTSARWCCATIAANEMLQATGRHRARVALFNAAKARAVELNRQLVVVGAPGNGFHTRIVPAYDCGDICVDLTGCEGCPVSVEVDLTVGKVDVVEDDSAVVFVSCVLEYTSDPQTVWEEVRRMAGSADNIFMVTVRPSSITSMLYPGAHFIIDQEGGEITARPIPTGLKVAIGAGIVTVGALSLLPSGRASGGKIAAGSTVHGRIAR